MRARPKDHLFPDQDSDSTVNCTNPWTSHYCTSISGGSTSPNTTELKTRHQASRTTKRPNKTICHHPTTSVNPTTAPANARIKLCRHPIITCQLSDTTPTSTYPAHPEASGPTHRPYLHRPKQQPYPANAPADPSLRPDVPTLSTSTRRKEPYPPGPHRSPKPQSRRRSSIHKLDKRTITLT